MEVLHKRSLATQGGGTGAPAGPQVPRIRPGLTFGAELRGEWSGRSLHSGRSLPGQSWALGDAGSRACPACPGQTSRPTATPWSPGPAPEPQGRQPHLETFLVLRRRHEQRPRQQPGRHHPPLGRPHRKLVQRQRSRPGPLGQAGQTGGCMRPSQ